ncbi:hypothetical protein CRENBAI_013327 [Crenichthys baileyi]|uniref:Uncharacterized protein n=1 Tax=Crenichthys baileyi TaxID=28760 RepID=A0AAV9R6E9_9TELE
MSSSAAYRQYLQDLEEKRVNQPGVCRHPEHFNITLSSSRHLPVGSNLLTSSGRGVEMLPSSGFPSFVSERAVAQTADVSERQMLSKGSGVLKCQVMTRNRQR